MTDAIGKIRNGERQAIKFGTFEGTAGVVEKDGAVTVAILTTQKPGAFDGIEEGTLGERPFKLLSLDKSRWNAGRFLTLSIEFPSTRDA